MAMADQKWPRIAREVGGGGKVGFSHRTIRKSGKMGPSALITGRKARTEEEARAISPSVAQGSVTLRLRDSDQVAKILRHSPSPSDVIFPETVTWYIMLVLMAIERAGDKRALAAVGSEQKGRRRRRCWEGGGAPLPSPSLLNNKANMNAFLAHSLTLFLSRQCPKSHFGIGPASRRKSE